MKSSDLLLVFSWFEWVHKQTIGSKRELHMAAKRLTNFKHSKGVSTFILILGKKQLNCKISKERRIVAASVEGLDYHIELHNPDYLEIKASFIISHYIYRSMY